MTGILIGRISLINASEAVAMTTLPTREGSVLSSFLW